MNVYPIDYARLGHWSHTDLAFIQHDPVLQPFMGYPSERSSFEEAIRARYGYQTDRRLLWRTILKQYTKLGLTPPVTEAIVLHENTFTITTAHQPTLLTGPLFNIYKIASVIHLSQRLKKDHPDHHMLPVFIIGGEDHDWAEVNHLHLFGKRIEWAREANGPCGRLSLEGLEAVIQTVNELFTHSPHSQDIRQWMESALHKASNYGEFHHLLIHGLFHTYGLVILNMDDPELKKTFIPLMEKEIREQFSFQLVSPTQAALEKAGFKPQAFCRHINLFYISDDRRERIDPAENGFLRVESGVHYSLEALIEELHQHPERFSPNVILRPLYQEAILPNLAYIGGGGEIAYWIERKSQFEAAKVHFPVLIRRNSLMLIDESTSAQISKCDLQWEDLLLEYDAVVKRYLIQHSQSDLHFTHELELIKSAFSQLAEKAEKIDPTLAKAILAEETKQAKQFEQLGSRLMRAEKQLHETQLKRIQKLKDRLFPEGGLQERYENFLPYYAHWGQEFIRAMIDICDPLEEKFMVVELVQKVPLQG